MLVPHAFATHFARTVELFRDPKDKTGQKAQFRALLVLLKQDAVTLKSDGGTVTVNGTAVDGAAFDPLRRQLERHSVGELTIPANPPPDQLFELTTDPLERDNRAEDPAAAEVLAELRAEVAARWDLERIDREVHESQRRRRTVVEALAHGRGPSWDYAPPYDAAHRYIRNHTDLGDLEAMARYPPAGTGPR